MMKKSIFIAAVALFVAAVGVVIALAAYFKSKNNYLYDDEDDFLFDDPDELDYYGPEIGPDDSLEDASDETGKQPDDRLDPEN